MKNILLPFSDDDPSEAAAVIAGRIAKNFDGLLEGLLAHEPIQVLVNEMVPAAYVTQISDQRRSDAATARQRFEDVAARLNLPFSETPEETGCGATWVEKNGHEDAIVGDYGRLFDLIVVPRRAGRLVTDWETTLESALFDSGRLVLLAPTEAGEHEGRNITIAWNGSTESARAISFSMPFLRQAETVTVLTVLGGVVPGPDNNEVAARLRRHGINAHATVEDPHGRLVGETIIESAHGLGSDMIIKGAYTHNRLRQMIFGGATRYIVANADLPVLMSH